ncbi:MAG: hypothetical protein ACRD68_01880 [Pyrinomonadaceae bacterium]
MKTAALMLLVALSSVCSGQASRLSAEGSSSWKAVLVSDAEPGEALIVSGKVYAADGDRPLAKASVYVYQTDARGYYGAGESNDSRNPRLRATMRTDAEGRYEFRTIKPGPYPGGGVPAHIHYVVSAPGHREKVFEIVFEGDPYVDERVRADARREESVFSIRTLEGDARGVLRCAQDVKLRRS